MVDNHSYYKMSGVSDLSEEAEILACIAAVTRYIQVAENARAENARAENARAENARAENARAENARAENARAENARAENAGAENPRNSPADESKGNSRERRSNWGLASLLEASNASAKASEPLPLRKGRLWGAAGALSLILLAFSSLAPACSSPEALNGDTFIDQEIAPDGNEQSRYRESATCIASRGNWAIQPRSGRSGISQANGSYRANAKPDPNTNQNKDYRQRLQDGKLFVRVALAINASDLAIDTVDGADLIDLNSGRQLASLHPVSQWKFSSRTAPGGIPAIAFTGKRNTDKYSLALGERRKGDVRNVAYFPGAAAVPPPDSGELSYNEQGVPFLTKPLVTALKLLPGQVYATTGSVLLSPQPSEGSPPVFSLNGRMYRGSLLIQSAPVKLGNNSSVTRLTAINIIDLEDYLRSVIPSEMPSSWHREALKAQAIAARSYAIANLGKYDDMGYDIKATVLDQVYKGVAAETISSNQAIIETKGVFMKHNGQAVAAFFHSSSAGHTDLAENVWTRELSFLKSVPDLDTDSKYVSWEKKTSIAQIESALPGDIGSLLGMFAVDRSPSGRVRNLLAVGSRGSIILPGTKIREYFGLPSTNFNVLAEGNAYTFKGQGHGHGLGMSQWGARALAEHGYNAGQILRYYYRDVTFEQLVETPTL